MADANGEDEEPRDPWYPILCLGSLLAAGAAFRFTPLPVAVVIVVALMALVVRGEGRVGRR